MLLHIRTEILKEYKYVATAFRKIDQEEKGVINSKELEIYIMGIYNI
jgi:hypothetical protein